MSTCVLPLCYSVYHESMHIAIVTDIHKRRATTITITTTNAPTSDDQSDRTDDGYHDDSHPSREGVRLHGRLLPVEQEGMMYVMLVLSNMIMIQCDVTQLTLMQHDMI